VNRRRDNRDDDREPDDEAWEPGEPWDQDEVPDADSFGYDSDADEEDEEYRDFIDREFGDQETRPRRYWHGKAVIVYLLLIAFILPFLLGLLQSFTR